MNATMVLIIIIMSLVIIFIFFFNDTATTEIYTLSLHDALPISAARCRTASQPRAARSRAVRSRTSPITTRSEEHTSELQSQSNLVCRLLLEKKKYKCKYISLHSADLVLGYLLLTS